MDFKKCTGHMKIAAFTALSRAFSDASLNLYLHQKNIYI